MHARHILTALILGLMAIGSLAGCESALFPPNEDRSVYDRYQRLHGQSRSANRLNEFGGEEPAVTERLRPLDRP